MRGVGLRLMSGVDLMADHGARHETYHHRRKKCMPGRRHGKEISQINADDDFAMVVRWVASVHDRTRSQTWVVAATTRRPNN